MLMFEFNSFWITQNTHRARAREWVLCCLGALLHFIGGAALPLQARSPRSPWGRKLRMLTASPRLTEAQALSPWVQMELGAQGKLQGVEDFAFASETP